MKKILVTILLITMMLFTMTACGGAGGTQATGNSDTAANTDASAAGNGGEDNGAEVDEAAADNGDGDGNSAAGKDTGSIYKESGMELTEYGTSFTDMETPYSDSVSSTESLSMDALGTSMALAMTNLELALFGGYDILSVDDLPKEEGKLLLSGFDAIREKSGKKINFSASQTYEEDGSLYKKGDKVTQKGVLDTSTNELTFEALTEREGKIIDRTVLETVILKDGTHLMQYFKVSKSFREDDPPTASAAFKRFNKDGYVGISAKFDPNYDFKYESILGKGDVQPDVMAKNYTLDGTLTVKDGKVDFKK